MEPNLTWPKLTKISIDILDIIWKKKWQNINNLSFPSPISIFAYNRDFAASSSPID